MGMFLNNNVSYKAYKAVVEDPYFVDKSELLAELFPLIGRKNRYVCITRPRRFGKTVMANMVGAFFGKTADTNLFDGLAVSQSKAYEQYLNKYDIIYIDFSRAPELCASYQAYITRIIDGLKRDLWDAFPDLEADRSKSIWDIMQEVNEKTNTTFVFVMDEWDAVFHMHFITEEDRKEYLLFLKYLLKDQPYVEFAYMTGVLPITKYSSGSELNMFAEYNMVEAEKFSAYFGFCDAEVDKLYQVYKETTKCPRFGREDLRIWYDGYYTAVGERLYNPRSIVLALTDNQLRNYWTSSGPYDEIFYYIRNNIQDVRDDIVLMVSGETVPIALQGYAVTGTELKTKNQIYSAMVVYGLLTYENKKVSIPNKELMDKFNELLLNNDCLGYVYSLARESERMLAATLAGDTNTMADILEYAHNTESPIFSYHSEIELAAVVNLVYLAARDRYRVEREDKAGKGYVDFIFYPEVKSADALILELKVGSTPKKAIQQIKDKNYVLRLRGKLGEEPKYTGKVLAVGISYSKKTKKHVCKVEVL